MGSIYLPNKRWDNDESNLSELFIGWTEKDRKELQTRLDIEIIRKVMRENKCPIYDNERYCHLYSEPGECSTGGKLVGDGYESKCSRYGKSLEELMDTFRKNIEVYSRNAQEKAK